MMPAHVAYEMQRKAAAHAYRAQMFSIVGPPPGLDLPLPWDTMAPSMPVPMAPPAPLQNVADACVKFQDARWGLEQACRLHFEQAYAKTSAECCQTDLERASTPTTCGTFASPPSSAFGDATVSDDEQVSVAPNGSQGVRSLTAAPILATGDARQLSVDQLSDGVRVFWPVNAQKLKCTDRHILSPSFELFDMTAKLMLKPIAVGCKRGESCFKRSKGRGCIELKCDAGKSADVSKFSFRLTIGNGSKWQPMRGPVTHDFRDGSVCGLPSDMEEWKFYPAVDADSNMFTLCLEVTPLS